MTVLFFLDNDMEYKVILDVQVKCLFLGLHLHFVVAQQLRQLFVWRKILQFCNLVHVVARKHIIGIQSHA